MYMYTYFYIVYLSLYQQAVQSPAVESHKTQLDTMQQNLQIRRKPENSKKGERQEDISIPTCMRQPTEDFGSGSVQFAPVTTTRKTKKIKPINKLSLLI